MKKIIPSLVLGIATSLLANDIGVVDTNILLIKGNPSNKSSKFGYYKNGEMIDIWEKVNGLDSDEKWLKTPKGYVKEAYVIEDSELPKLIEENELYFNKNALQLAVIQKGQKNILFKHRNLLKDFNNVYIRETNKAYVLFLVNFDSYTKAKEAKVKIAEYFPDAFIIKLKGNSRKSSSSIVKKESPIKKKEDIKKNITQKKSTISKNNNEIDMNEIDKIINSLDDAEDIELEPRKNIEVKKETPKEIVPQVIEPVVIPPIENKKVEVKKEIINPVVSKKEPVKTEVVQKVEPKKVETVKKPIEKRIIKEVKKEEPVSFEKSVEDLLLHMR